MGTFKGVSMSGSSYKNLTGLLFDRLTVVSLVGKLYGGYSYYWNCICSCGNPVVARGSHLTQGHIKSCGCLGNCPEGHGLSGHPLYPIWDGMHGRCYRKGNGSYPYYGGNGITVCFDWHQFINFYN